MTTSQVLPVIGEVPRHTGAEGKAADRGLSDSDVGIEKSLPRTPLRPFGPQRDDGGGTCRREWDSLVARDLQ